MKQELVRQFKKAVVFLGHFVEEEERKIEFFATAFLVKIQGVYHLVTAKHVVTGAAGSHRSDVHAFFNKKNGGWGGVRLDEMKTSLGVNWVFHKDDKVDICVIPFGLDPESDDVKTVPDDLFLDVGELWELQDVFFVSYQPGVAPGETICPVTRTGTISLINGDGTFLIDGAAFPGNSGSPVFVRPSPTWLRSGRVVFGSNPFAGKFIGVIGGYIPYKEAAISAQTGRARVIFEENTGLSKVWSVHFVREIIGSDQFRHQLERIRTKES